MEIYLIIVSLIILFSIFIEKISAKFGIPVLFLFLMMGVVSGNASILHPLIVNKKIIEYICIVALIFIMFYGGFGTNLQKAKKVMKDAFILASFGVIVNIFLLTIFLHYVFKLGIGEAALLASILGSTDAASLFNILRYNNLSLKYNLDSLLEIESGSNDPFAYICTLMAILFLQGNFGISNGVIFLIKEIIIGILVAMIIAKLMSIYINKQTKYNENLNQIVFIAIALLSYNCANVLGGNGFLSVYIVGMILGRENFDGKQEMVHFFDGLTSLFQLVLFFLLGLLVKPSNLLELFPVSLSIVLFIILVSRPISILPFFYKYKDKGWLIVTSMAGIRGAASIVFAISAINSGIELNTDIYNIVALVVLISLVLQGGFLPIVVKKASMLNEKGNILSTFNDYVSDKNIGFIISKVGKESPWLNRKIKEFTFPKDIRIILVNRNNKPILPDGELVLKEGDRIVLSAIEYSSDNSSIDVRKIVIDEDHEWFGKKITDINILDDRKIIMIERNGQIILPNGDVCFENQDEVFISKLKQKNC